MNKSLNLYIGIILFSIGCGPVDYTEELSGSYYYASESADNSIIVKHISKEGDKYIPCNVVDYVYNDDFILAKQEPQSSCFSGIDSTKYGSEQYYYWIIVHNKSLISGPFTYAEYLMYREYYAVPDILRL